MKKKEICSQGLLLFMLCSFMLFFNEGCTEIENQNDQLVQVNAPEKKVTDTMPGKIVAVLGVDTVLYNKKMLQLAHDSADEKWPVIAPYPLPGAILPFKRIVAFYGNFYSKGMGILGELSTAALIPKLQIEVDKWTNADTSTPVLPAIHYIAVTAQGSPGRGGKYRLRMPFSEVDKAIKLADTINGIVFLDIQVGLSNLESEIPLLEKYLMMPQVHLGIDPEFSMKSGKKPGSEVGTFDAKDVNYAATYLANLVTKHNLPPKILIVHRFTQNMLTNYKAIVKRPEVQLVVEMDGFGFPAKKVTTYVTRITREPVQFAGFKLFFKNDREPPRWKEIMQPAEILALRPSPIYIQYQ